MKKILVPCFALALSACAVVPETPSEPEFFAYCSSKDAWAASMAFVKLRNAGVIRSEDYQHDKTTVERLVSEKIGNDLYRQVHKVTLHARPHQELQVITVNNVSSEECSMSDVDVYLVRPF